MKYERQISQASTDGNTNDIFIMRKFQNSLRSSDSRKEKGRKKMKHDRQKTSITNIQSAAVYSADSDALLMRYSNRFRINTVWRMLVLLLTAATSFGQNTRKTDYSPDKSLKSNARVNPSTLAMEMSVPIGGYPGRAGNDLPINFNYSSKVWQLRTLLVHERGGTGGLETDVVPLFAKRSAAGWTSGLGTPQIDYPADAYYMGANQIGYEGQSWSFGTEPESNFNIFQIKRLYINMPDGSSHEVRASDTPIQCGTAMGGCPPLDLTGTYLSVDGSKLRLEWGTNESTLYMPDGSRYLFGSWQGGPTGDPATTYIDRNGNRMNYDNSNKQWTDTMGRLINNPLPGNYALSQDQTVGDQTLTLPGMNNGTINATLSWRHLKDPNGGESGLNDPNQSLVSAGDNTCHNTNPAPTGTSLFTTGNDVAVCNFYQEGNVGIFNPVVLTKITYPNGSSYQFKYNLYGEIEKIIYPSGGYERFRYEYIDAAQRLIAPYALTNRGVVERWVSPKGDGTDEQHWTYSASRGLSYPFNPYKIVTTAPDGTRTEQILHDEPDLDQQYRPYGFNNIKTGRPYETRVYSASNQLLRRTLTAYEVTQILTGEYPTSGIPATRDIRPVKEVSITFEPGATSALAMMSETVYDTNSDPAYFAQLNPKVSKTYHYIAVDLTTAQGADISTIAALFSSSNLAQTAETDYLYDGNYKARNLVTLPTETRIKDAAGNIVAKSQMAYDEGAYGILSAGSDAQWTDPNTTLRGNATTARAWTDVANNTYVETHAQFDNFGNARKSWDAKGNLSEVEYASAYKYAYPTKTISTVPDPSGQNGSSTAFETTSVYDLNTGLTLSTTDANGQTSQMEYNDSLLRPTKVIPPTGGAQTVMEYTDTPGAMKIVTKTQIDGTNWAESTVYTDGLGRAIKSEKKDDQGNVFTETEYDNMGRVKKATNPFRNGETKLWTENTYDDLSRITKVKTPDNAEVTTSFDLATSGTLGTVVIVTDQAGKIRRSVTNGLGQLARVDEPNDAGSLGTVASPNQSTSYIYDTLGKMVKVTQGVQARFFKYDSLGRLLRVRQPEQATNSSLALTDAATGNSDWSAGFTYDANGNLLTAIDTKGTVITSAYDNLNRVKTRSYSDSTPQVSYKYDDPAVSYAKGRLTKTSNAVSVSQILTLDNLGRVLSSRQTTDGVNYDSAYTYNLSGGLLEETYPSGRKVKNTLATDGDLAKVETKTASGAYATRADSFNYAAHGAIKHLQIGSGLWQSAQFNNRLQVTQLALGTSSTDTSKWKLDYDFGNATENNGNIKAQTVTSPVGTYAQSFTYDSLDRLKTAQETSGGNPTWTQQFTYDRYGNRTGFSQNFNGQTTTTTPSIDANTNRFNLGQGYTYDAAGNVITDPQGRQFTFNGDNKQTEVKDSSNNIVGTYTYDGDGKRIRKVTAQENTTFVYSGGKLVAEYQLTTAAPQAATTQYLGTDMLGSPRVVSDQTGAVVSRRDFMPFGEDLTRANGSDSIIQRFINKKLCNSRVVSVMRRRLLKNSRRFFWYEIAADGVGRTATGLDDLPVRAEAVKVAVKGGKLIRTREKIVRNKENIWAEWCKACAEGGGLVMIRERDAADNGGACAGNKKVDAENEGISAGSKKVGADERGVVTEEKGVSRDERGVGADECEVSADK